MSNYGAEYLDRRDVDVTEWWDILRALKAVGAKKGDSVFEIGCGRGDLLLLLRRKGFIASGCDLIGDGVRVAKCDLERELPPEADYYVHQHVLEHLNQDRVVELLRYMLEEGRAVVGVVPGHRVFDPTHVVNHYELSDLEELVRRVDPPFYSITPDTASFFDPSIRDWILVLSNNPIRKIRPLYMRAGFCLLKKIWRWLRWGSL